jgi:hypothetical protein
MAILFYLFLAVIVVYAIVLAADGVESIDNWDLGNIPYGLDQTIKFIFKVLWCCLVAVGTILLAILMAALIGAGNKDNK